MPFRYLVWIGLSGLVAHSVEGQARPGFPAGNTPGVGYLGVFLADIDAERAKALKLPEEMGAEVTRLLPTSPAAAAGLRLNDVIAQYNGQRVEGWLQLSRLISETPVGRDVKIQIYRKGYPSYLIAKIGAKPKEPVELPVIQLGPSAVGAVPDIPVSRMSFRSWLGAEWESLDGQLANVFGVKDGVLVRSVIASSPAGRAGLRAGDVIVRVGDAKVATASELTAYIRAGRTQVAALTVVRDLKEMSLTIPLDGSKNGE